MRFNVNLLQIIKLMRRLFKINVKYCIMAQVHTSTGKLLSHADARCL